MLFTIGHGDRDVRTFVDMLRDARVRVLVDVPRYPGSRRRPHFGREALAAALSRASTWAVRDA